MITPQTIAEDKRITEAAIKVLPLQKKLASRDESLAVAVSVIDQHVYNALKYITALEASQAECERLRESLIEAVECIGCGCGGDHGLCKRCNISYDIIEKALQAGGSK